MPSPQFPDAEDYLAHFSRYRDESGARDFGRVYLEPDDERYRLLFEQICRLLTRESAFNQAMPPEFRRTARQYLDGNAKTVARMSDPQMRHFMLSDLHDYVHLCSRMWQRLW
jgi:predicted metal-dependent hydrolase